MQYRNARNARGPGWSAGQAWLRAASTAAALLALWPQASMAGNGNAELNFTLAFTNCCGFYPLVPSPPPQGWQTLAAGGFAYEGKSLDSVVRVLAGLTPRQAGWK